MASFMRLQVLDHREVGPLVDEHQIIVWHAVCIFHGAYVAEEDIIELSNVLSQSAWSRQLRLLCFATDRAIQAPNSDSSSLGSSR